MKDFRFRALCLSNSTTPPSFAKALETGKCHLPGLFGDLKSSRKMKPVTTFGKKGKVFHILGHTLCTHFSGMQAQGEFTCKYPGTGNRRNTQENNVWDNSAPTGSWALIQVIRSFTCFWR